MASPDLESEIRSVLAGVVPNRRTVETLAADADLASAVALDSLGFIQFLSGLERRLGIDLSANIEQLKAVRTLADIVALTERMRAA